MLEPRFNLMISKIRGTAKMNDASDAHVKTFPSVSSVGIMAIRSDSLIVRPSDLVRYAIMPNTCAIPNTPKIATLQSSVENVRQNGRLTGNS